eukprot:21777-Rhodomonas_salina.4
MRQASTGDGLGRCSLYRCTEMLVPEIGLAAEDLEAVDAEGVVDYNAHRQHPPPLYPHTPAQFQAVTSQDKGFTSQDTTTTHTDIIRRLCTRTRPSSAPYYNAHRLCTRMPHPSTASCAYYCTRDGAVASPMLIPDSA